MGEWHSARRYHYRILRDGEVRPEQGESEREEMFHGVVSTDIRLNIANPAKFFAGTKKGRWSRPFRKVGCAAPYRRLRRLTLVSIAYFAISFNCGSTSLLFAMRSSLFDRDMAVPIW